MPKLEDPASLSQSIEAYRITVYIIFGMSVWETVTSLDYDWMYWTGMRKMSSTAALVYFLARYGLLLTLILGIRILHVESPAVNCQVWMYATITVAYGTVRVASGLLFLRVFALSRRNKYAMTFLSVLYLANWACVAWGVYQSRGVYIPEYKMCVETSFMAYRLNAIFPAVFDLTCLALMCWFLFTITGYGASTWTLVMKQSLIHAVVIVVVYIVVVALLCLDLNDAISQTANNYGRFVLVICACRLHRNLVIFYTNTSNLHTWDIGSAAQPQFARPDSHVTQQVAMTVAGSDISDGVSDVNQPRNSQCSYEMADRNIPRLNPNHHDQV